MYLTYPLTAVIPFCLQKEIENSVPQQAFGSPTDELSSMNMNDVKPGQPLLL